MGQHLQGVEARIDHNLCLRHLSYARIQSRLGRAGTSSALLSLLLHFTSDGIGKTKEKWVTRSENHYLIMILFEDGIEGDGDIYPLCVGR